MFYSEKDKVFEHDILPNMSVMARNITYSPTKIAIHQGEF